MIMDNAATKADLQDIRNEIRYEMSDDLKDVNHRIDLVVN